MNNYSPNKIEFSVNSCGGELQISEINYPGWKIFIDDQQETLEPNNFFRIIYVPKGEHVVRMVYRPFISIGSAILQFGFWIIILGIIFYFYRNEHEKNLV
jgi:hypothetical protein